MKKLFVAIRQGNLHTVKELLDKKPELISCTAKQPPKKDDGQSPLQVAIKSNHLDIVTYLLDRNADVNFMESVECCNEWRMPVIQDAIMSAVMHSRWNIIDYNGAIKVFHTKKEADDTYAVLKRMLELGADITCKDSYGNSCLQRAVLDGRQILPSYHYQTNELASDRMITDEITQDLTRVFRLLYEYGADCDEINRISGKSMLEHYKQEPVGDFLLLGKKMAKVIS